MKLPFSSDKPSRRQLLTRGGAAAVAAAIGAGTPCSVFGAGDFADSFDYCTFTKWLQMKSYDELADVIAGLGFDGAEAPVYVKESAWDDNELSWGPGGEGIGSDTFFKELKRTKFDGPISLHVEYLGHGDESKVPTIIEATRKDFATLRKRLNKA